MDFEKESNSEEIVKKVDGFEFKKVNK